MTLWLCATCAVEQGEDAEALPAVCPICADDRQYVLPSGQRWTSLAELTDGARSGVLNEVEPGLLDITIEPQVGIGQRGLLVQTAAGNLLWDPTGYFDEDLVKAVGEVGGVAAVATSHPHMYGLQVEWSRAFGGVPVFVSARDQDWVQRPDPVIQVWDDTVEVLPGVTLHRIGGHFPGSAVARFVGADEQGVLLSGDTVASTPGGQWVSFMRSYPNKVPLSAAVVERIAGAVVQLDFDRLYDNFSGEVRADARAVVRRSAERYAAWVRGDFDHLT